MGGWDKIVLGMALLRFISSSIEFSAALLMLAFNSIESALKINAALALVGPTIMLAVTSLGLFGLAGKLSFFSMLLIVSGVALILLGLRSL
ncbi:MAG: YqhV family protein [Bacillota bacterium]|uniref:YqhV family protein n=1 Tax=Desulfurispora thermophila TaxID=265470 RepID=UPI003BC0836E